MLGRSFSNGQCAGRRWLGRRPNAICSSATICRCSRPDHLVGQAVTRYDRRRHKRFCRSTLGDGIPLGVNRRGRPRDEKYGPARPKLGVSVVTGFNGLAHLAPDYSFPPVPQKIDRRRFDLLAERWTPILDVFGECGVKFALECASTAIAFDTILPSGRSRPSIRREEFGFNFDLATCSGRGRPVEFIRRVPRRIYHVHIKTRLSL